MFFPKVDAGTSTLRTPGFVYFIRAKITGLIKIGWATNPGVRLSHLQAMSPDILEIVAQMAGTGKDERSIHGRFAHIRRHGEWFAPDAELIAFMTEVGIPAPASLPKPTFGSPYNPHDDARMRRSRILVQSLG